LISRSKHVDEKAEEEKDGTSQEQPEYKLRIYQDVLKTVRELQEFSLHHSNSE
jgi:hypothetical protein